MEVVFSIDDINTVANQIIASNPEKIILFNGEMGVGKTTLIKEICRALGVQNATSSPTFSLVNEYLIADNHKIYHFDMYRLKSDDEALDMGIDDYLYSNNWCFIEWSEKIINLIPANHSVIELSLQVNGTRKLVLS